MLRWHIGLACEVPEADLFPRIVGYEVAREGGVFGWLNPCSEFRVASAQAELQVGNPDRKDGKHLLYARESGAIIRLSV